MTTPEQKATDINCIIEMGKELNLDTNLISDGYHTFGELYDHRITLFVAICKIISVLRKRNIISDLTSDLSIWKSKKHHNGSEFDGWFIMGISKTKGEQITYHLPVSKWDDCYFAEVIDKAPEWDGHTSADVIKRLKLL